MSYILAVKQLRDSERRAGRLFADGEFEYTHSAVRTAFETALGAENWHDAFLNLNGLSMFELVRAIPSAKRGKFDELWIRRGAFEPMINLPRIHYARDAALNKVLPDIPVGDLGRTGQVADVANFLAEQFVAVAKVVNPDPAGNISLILQECNFYGISDKSHIAYVLASAHHESGIGKSMTEGTSGAQYEGRVDLGNTHPGDGVRFKGRGFVQITGRKNYTFYTGFLATRGLTVDLVATPTRATERAVAAIIIAHGMRYGNFTGARLSQFGSDCNFNYVKARAVVNGKGDKAALIAKTAQKYRKAMH